MKKQITTIALSICALCATIPNKVQAQDGFWIDLGAKGGFGTTWLFNKNTLGGTNISNDFSLGWSYGAKLGLNFTNIFEITAEGLLTTFNQGYTITTDDPGSKTWSKKLTGSLIDIPVLVRLNLDGTYVEFGPQFSLVSSFKESNTGDYPATPASGIDVTSNFNSMSVGAVVGFGRWIKTGADNFNLALGLRFMYGFGDIISQKGGQNSANYYPVSMDPAFTNPMYKTKPLDAYAATNPFSAMLVFEMNFDLASIMLRHVCHRTAGR